MNMTKKGRTASEILRTQGVLGLYQIIHQKLMQRIPRSARIGQTADLFTSSLLFRYATCDDLVKLKAKYPECCFFGDPISNASEAWGLKQMGTLFCVAKIADLAPARLLEVGAGCNTFFDERLGHQHEYWMLDDAGFYPKEKFDAAIQKRRHTRLVRGLLGAYSTDLPDNYFDLVFSLSVLEHVPASNRADVYKDMYRVVRPGGHIVHSIDLAGGEQKGRREYDTIRAAGFLLPPKPDLTIRVKRGEGESTLFESVCIVFRTYFGKGRKDIWTNLRSIQEHRPTILVVARKPLPDKAIHSAVLIKFV